MASNEEVTFRKSKLGDLENIYHLFSQSFTSSPSGFLDPKTIEELKGLLQYEPNANIYATIGKIVVGYSLTPVMNQIQWKDSYALRDAIPLDTPAGYSRGYAVNTEYRGKSIGIGILKARKFLLRSIGVRSAFGVVLPENVASIVSIHRTGGVMCGSGDDGYGNMGFLHITSDMLGVPEHPANLRTETDISKMYQLFRDKFVCVGVRKENGKTGFVFTDDYLIAA